MFEQLMLRELELIKLLERAENLLKMIHDLNDLLHENIMCERSVHILNYLL